MFIYNLLNKNKKLPLSTVRHICVGLKRFYSTKNDGSLDALDASILSHQDTISIKPSPSSSSTEMQNIKTSSDNFDDIHVEEDGLLVADTIIKEKKAIEIKDIKIYLALLQKLDDVSRCLYLTDALRSTIKIILSHTLRDNSLNVQYHFHLLFCCPEGQNVGQINENQSKQYTAFLQVAKQLEIEYNNVTQAGIPMPSKYQKAISGLILSFKKHRQKLSVSHQGSNEIILTINNCIDAVKPNLIRNKQLSELLHSDKIKLHFGHFNFPDETKKLKNGKVIRKEFNPGGNDQFVNCNAKMLKDAHVRITAHRLRKKEALATKQKALTDHSSST